MAGAKTSTPRLRVEPRLKQGTAAPSLRIQRLNAKQMK